MNETFLMKIIQVNEERKKKCHYRPRMRKVMVLPLFVCLSVCVCVCVCVCVRVCVYPSDNF